MFMPHQSREGSSRRISRSTSGKPLSEDEQRERLREAGRHKLNMFKQRQLQELQRNQGGPFASLLSMAAPLVATTAADIGEDAPDMGSPMSKWQHSLRSSSACSRQPSGESAAVRSSVEVAAQPKIKPVFRPIRTPAKQQPPSKQEAAAEAPGPAARQTPTGEGLEDMVQILVQQVSQLQAEKQQMVQRCSTLELENANLQELVGFLSEAADMSHTDGSLEVCEQDLEEIYTVIVEDDQQLQDTYLQSAAAIPEAAAGDQHQSAVSAPE